MVQGMGLEMDENYAKFGSYVAGVMDGYAETTQDSRARELAIVLIAQAMDVYGLTKVV